MKKSIEKIVMAYYHLKIDKLLKISNYLVYLLFIAFIIGFVNKTFQNDTFYTIKVGDLIRNNGIDFKDHFCFVKNLSYTYPHFLYDVLISFIYFKFDFFGIYISTCIFTFIIAICLYKTNSKLSNKYISFVVTMIELFLLTSFFTARAQVATFPLFILTYYFIVKFLYKPKFWYALVLIIIPIIIANTHVAVFPFYFIIYLPFFFEYFIAFIMKKRKKKLEYFKLKIDDNKNVKKLMIIFFITLFTGLLTPLKFIPYTYLINTLRGNSMSMIQEHLPLVLYNNKAYFVYLSILILIMVFSKVKICLKDLFFFIGMTLLSFMQTRQISMSVIFNGFILCKILKQIIEEKNLSEYKVYKYQKCIYLPIIFVLCIGAVIYVPSRIKRFEGEKYVDDTYYPVRVVNYIKSSIDYKNKKFFNAYDYGSYMLFNDIPVFVDSRADLYTKEFNKFEGRDILSEVDSFYYNMDRLVEKYDFDYFVVEKDRELDILIKKAYPYKLVYEDIYFALYEREKEG